MIIRESMSWTRGNEQKDGERIYTFYKWMSWLFLALSVLVLIYIYYRAEVFYQGNLGTMYFKYYLISIFGIIFWTIVLRLRATFRANIVTIFMSLVVGLYLVEGVLNFLNFGQPYSPYLAAAAAEGVEFDKRSRFDVIEDLISEEVDAVTLISPSLFTNKIGTKMEDIAELFPFGGLSNKIIVGPNETGHFMIYPSDRYGFNNPDSEWNNETVDWALIGDSMTEGVAVQPGEDIAGQIRTITNQSAINLGKGGSGPLIELAALTEYAEAKNRLSSIS